MRAAKLLVTNLGSGSVDVQMVESVEFKSCNVRKRMIDESGRAARHKPHVWQYRKCVVEDVEFEVRILPNA